MEAFNVENVVLFLFLIAPDKRGVGVGEKRQEKAAQEKPSVCSAGQ